jgi:hypothetical protein
MVMLTMKSIARRIEKLEAGMLAGFGPEPASGWRAYRGRRKSSIGIIPPRKLRFGNLRRLPPDYQGERHIEIITRLPDQNGQEWVEFAEVPGPDSPVSEKNGRVEYFNIMFVAPYPVLGD